MLWSLVLVVVVTPVMLAIIAPLSIVYYYLQVCTLHFYRVQLCFCKSRLRAPVHSGCLLTPPPERMDPSTAHHLPNPPVHKHPVPSMHAELHLQLQLQLQLLL